MSDFQEKTQECSTSWVLGSSLSCHTTAVTLPIAFLPTSCRTSQASASAPQRAGTFCQPFRSKSFHIPSAFFLRMCWRALKQIKIAEHHFLNGVTRVLCGESNSAPRVTDFFDPLQTGGSQSDTRTHAQLPRFLPERICTRYGTKPLPSRYGYAQRSILTLRHYSHSIVRI